MVAGEVTAAPMGEMEPTSPSEAFICLKVKDVLGLTRIDTLQRFVYPADTTFQTLFDDVSNRFKIDIAEFDLTYQDRMDLYELSGMPSELCLTAANLLPSKSKEYAVSITTRSKKNKKKYLESITRNLETSFAQFADNDGHAAAAGDGGGGCIVETLDEQRLTVESLLPRRKEFVGIRNSNMTCYLTSMIQGLFFTPSFRNLVNSYQVDLDPRLRKNSIVFQLQKMFLQLQFSTRDAIDTEELTRTFGWTDRDTSQQHDIQELCSVLMEMMTNEFKGTPQDGIINKLYYGLLTDYVKCLGCNNFRHKPDEILVLPLPIKKPDRTPLDNPTLEEALKTFVTPEVLNGSNQYDCEKCGKSFDAHKGYLFKSLPSIFIVQLKRFDFDWETNRRYKLNDHIRFSVVLDMNPYMDTSMSNCQTENGNEGQEHSVNMDLLKPTVDADVTRTAHSRPSVELTVQNGNQSDFDVAPEAEEVTDMASELNLTSGREAVVAKLREIKSQNGPNVYELFAVFVHRGGLAGGHYYSYIKDFETYRWYRFDDSNVRPACEDDIRATFSEVADTDQTSAYMLMYQRFENDNVLPFLKTQMPQHVLDIWERLLQDDKRAKNIDVLEKSTIRMTVKYRPYKSWETRCEEMFISKSLTTRQVSQFVFKSFFPDVPSPPLDNIRVCRYDLDLGVIENNFEEDDKYFVYSLKHPPPKTKNEGLILEVLNDGEYFYRYQAEDLVFVTLLTNTASESVLKWEEFHADTTFTVGDLRKNIACQWGLDEASLYLIIEMPGETLFMLMDPSELLTGLVSTKIHRLFVECLPETDLVQAWLSFVSSFISVSDYAVQVQRPPEEMDTTTPESQTEPSARLSRLDGIDMKIVVTTDPPSPTSNNASLSTQSGGTGSELGELLNDSDVSMRSVGSGSPFSYSIYSGIDTSSSSLSPGSEGPKSVVSDGSPSSRPPLVLSELTEALPSSPEEGSVSNGIEVDAQPQPDEDVDAQHDQDSSTFDAVTEIHVAEVRRVALSFTSPAPGSGPQNEWIPFTVNMDSRVKMSVLSRGMAEVLAVGEDQFSFFYFNKDNDEVEVTDYAQTVRNYAGLGGNLRVRFCPRLKKDEGRVAVFLMNLNDLPRCGAYLGDAILHECMNMGLARETVLNHCKSAVGNLNPEKCRLRKKLSCGRVSKVFRDKIPVSDWLTKVHEAEIYLQVSDKDSQYYPPLDRDTFVVTYRRWHPDTWELEPPQETTVYHDHSCELLEVVFVKMIEVTGIPLERIELAKVEAPFPYDLNPLAIQELGWVTGHTAQKPMYFYNDELVLFVSDCSEVKRSCTVQEEQEYRVANESTVQRYDTSPRREIGIKINLNNKTPESSSH